MAAATVTRWKGMIAACAFGAVTFVGTIYGAGLKTQQEYQTVCSSPLHASFKFLLLGSVMLMPEWRAGEEASGGSLRRGEGRHAGGASADAGDAADASGGEAGQAAR